MKNKQSSPLVQGTNHLSGRQLAPLLFTGLLVAASSAFAIDVSEVITILGVVAVSVAAVGVAIISVKGAMIGIPWILKIMGFK